ncbi:hypothetical protein ABPG72_003698 [Tetrahymena utriculariae]
MISQEKQTAKKKFDIMFLKGILAILGGFLIHLTCGTLYMWGVINIYVTSYLRLNGNPDLSIDLGSGIFPFMMVAVACGVPVGMKAIKYVGSTRIVCYVCSLIASLCIFLVSFAQVFWLFVIIYGIIFGFFTGIMYMVPIYLGQLYFPSRRGLVSGFILTGYGLGSLIYSQFFFYIVNPQNLKAKKAGDGGSYFFGDAASVANAVPEALRWLSLMYVLQLLIGSSLLFEHPNSVGSKQKELRAQLKLKRKEQEELKLKNDNSKKKQIEMIQNTEKDIEQQIQKQDQVDNQQIQYINTYGYIQTQADPQDRPLRPEMLESQADLQQLQKIPNTVQDYNDGKTNISEEEMNERIQFYRKLGAPSIKEALKTKEFYISQFIILLACGLGLLISGNYKKYGQQNFTNDQVLTIIGSVASAANGCSRFLWASLLDKISFRKVISVILVAQIILSVTLQFSVKDEYFYLVWVFFVSCCLGGLFGIYPVYSTLLFGSRVGSEIYGTYWLSVSAANFIQFGLVYNSEKNIHFSGIFYIYFAFNILALIVVIFAKMQLDWSKYYLRNTQHSNNAILPQPEKILSKEAGSNDALDKHNN